MAVADSFGDTLAILAGPDFATDRTGSQLYVSRYGEPLLEAAVGARDIGAKMTAASRPIWLCCSKPVLLIALCRIFADHDVSVDAPVADVIPEFAKAGKGDVLFSHVLTHTVPYQSLGVTWMGTTGRVGDESYLAKAEWDDAVEIVCSTPLSGRPGAQVTYCGFTNWLVLAEAVQRLTGRSHEESVRELVLRPLSMDDTSVYLTQDDVAATELAPLWDLGVEGAPEVDSVDVAPWLFSRWPGIAVRGPVRDMAKPIECAAGWRGPELLDDGWRTNLLEPRRLDRGDPVFQGAEIMWSLGLCADPVAYGLSTSKRAVGHTGFRSSFVFADLETGIVMSFVSTGAVPKNRDWSRKRSLVRAVYREQGLR